MFPTSTSTTAARHRRPPFAVLTSLLPPLVRAARSVVGRSSLEHRASGAEAGLGSAAAGTAPRCLR
jgi:hypothetical protein